MIRYIEDGDIFATRADALVNPVNCVGVMGRGLALEFKHRFPEYFPPYKRACDLGKLVPGRPLCLRLLAQPDLLGPLPAVVMFPTKKHWKDKSRLEWVDQGLAYMQQHLRQWRLGSIAMPQVGCGLGGLDWQEVRPLIERYFLDEPVGVEVYIRTDREADQETDQAEPAPEQDETTDTRGKLNTRRSVEHSDTSRRAERSPSDRPPNRPLPSRSPEQR